MPKSARPNQAVSVMVVGAAIASLVAEGSQELATAAAVDGMQGGAACDAAGCKP